MRRLFLSLLLIVLAAPAFAALSQDQIQSVGIDQHVGATFPATTLTDLKGKHITVPPPGGRLPSLVAFVDYTCHTSCGVSVDALLSCLSGLDMRPGRDFNVYVIGLDPKDGLKEAAAFAKAHRPDTARWAPIEFLIGGRAVIAHLLDVAGYHIAYDTEHDQFAHPTGMLLLDAAGTIRRYVDPFLADPLDFRLSLTDAGDGAVGSVADRVFLTCYGWNATTGSYSPLIGRILTGSGVLTALALGALISVLLLRERRAAKTGGA
jgi:protein SCO1/2